jgi:D-alanyl-D-alanine dipeptidase
MIYWLFSVNPLDNFLQKATYEKLQNEIDKSKNKTFLNSIMHQNGFVAYDHEYWHSKAIDETCVRENCEHL